MPQYLTKQGLEKLKKELDLLKNVKRREIAKTLSHTASFGDLRENFGYQQAKEDQMYLEKRIAELEDIIRNANIIEKRSSDRVQLGSVVTLNSDKDKQVFQIQIVSREETNPLQGRISLESPLGQAIFGKSKGEIAVVETLEGKTKYKILNIE